MENLIVATIGIATFVASYGVMNAYVPDITVKRVGAISHWRCGRIGGSFYRAKR